MAQFKAMASLAALLLLLTAVILSVSCESNPHSEKRYLGYHIVIKTKNNYDLLKKFVNHPSKIALLASEPTLNTPASVLVDASYQTKAEFGMYMRGFEYKLIHEDVLRYLKTQQNYMPKKATSFDFKNFYDIAVINEWLVKMEKTHSDLAKVVIGGESSEGRNITGLKISSSIRNHEMENKEKPIFVIEAGIHAREWIAPSTAAYVIHQLLTNDSAPIRELRDTYEWHIFPVLNPDGYHFSHKGGIEERYWRKNRAKTSTDCIGVDLNRNWDYNWESRVGISSDPCDDTYGGTKAFSEKESSTFRNYLLSLKNITVYSDFHSFAKVFLIPYADSKEHTENFDDMASIGANALKYLESIRGTKYGIGTAPELLWYGCAGTSIDWVKETLKAPIVWCYKLGGGDFAPKPCSIIIEGVGITNSLIGFHERAKELGYIKNSKKITI